MRAPHRFVLAFSIAGFAATASGQTFQLEIERASSSIALDADFAAELPSSVIGNYDARTNPGGTRTLPGFGGGPGNEPIAMELTLGGATAFVGTPLGGFEMSVDEVALSIELGALEIDLLGGAKAPSALTLTLLYSTFRSFQPDSLYLGGFPIELPLGEATIVDARVVQTGAAAGALVPGRDPGQYGFELLLPAELTLAIDAMGEVVPLGPVSVVVPIAGELVLAGGTAGASFALEFALDQKVPDPLPGFAIEDAPFDLPTILPPGETAHLLLDATIASISVVVAMSGSISATGAPACGFESYCEAVPNSTGAAAWLETTGSPDAAAGDLTFFAHDLPPHTTGFFVMASEAAFLPGYRGHTGNLCLSPPHVRFAHDVLDSGPEGNLRYSPDFADLPNDVVFLPGSTWHFQLWYRDLDPGPTWNSSNGARVRFCAAD